MTPFSYQRPASLQEAVGLLAGAAAPTTILAGGQSLLLALKDRKARPDGIVAVGALPDMRGVRTGADGKLEIGAATTYAVLAKAELPGWQAELAAVAGNLADRSVRNIGTVGGGVCQADPRYDMPVVLSAAGASFMLVSARGSRNLPAEAFFNIKGGTHIAKDEIMTAIVVPALAEWTHLAFEKFRYRTFEAAIGSVGVAAQLDASGKIERIRIVVGAVAKAPVLAERAMAACLGLAPAALPRQEIAAMASRQALPLELAVTRQQKYQSELTVSLVKRALVRLAETNLAGEAA